MHDFSDVYSTGHVTRGTTPSADCASKTGPGRATSANRAARKREAVARSPAPRQHDTAEDVMLVDVEAYRRAGAL